jgi:hypothetical protein
MHHTSHTHALRLPASEHAKLAPSRPRDHGHNQPVAELAPQAADIVHARAGQTRHVHHLSGFARA